MNEILAIIGLFTLIYAIFSERLERAWISGPMAFVAFGVIVGPLGIGLLDPDEDPTLLRTLAELTLALVLFTDAAESNIGLLRRIQRLPSRLLVFGLPMTIAIGFGVGLLLFPEWPVLEVALLATILAPTDAALGKAVITSPYVPPEIRETLNVESGLNDGICVPVLFLLLAMISGENNGGSFLTTGIALFIEEVGIGIAIAVAICGVTVGLMHVFRNKGWTLLDGWESVTVLALAFSCYGLAQSLGGSGFIACFVGGLLFGIWNKPHHKELAHLSEGIGNAFSLATWILFGALVIGPIFAHINAQSVVYAAMSLTLFRMLPVYLSMSGLGITAGQRLFMGWFGPRGLASVVFVVIVMDTQLQKGNEITLIVACTVMLSIVTHGLSATPLTKLFS